ncbi:MAG: hypothetical protein WCO23_01645 [bacterium]
MILTAHMISGGVTGEIIGNPVIAFVVGIILHFVLDAIPHFDVLDEGRATKRQFIFSVTETVVGLLFIFGFIRPELSWSSPFLWGMAGSILPDLITNVPFWWNFTRNRSKIGKAVYKLHLRIHKKQPSFAIGMLIRLVVVIFFISLLVLSRSSIY